MRPGLRPSRLALLLVAGAVAACAPALFTAPPGSDLTALANPDFIPSHGGVSLITVIVIEPAGTPVADGTLVFFFTNLGNIPREARTRNGVARVNFVSGALSGTATITAVSGGTPAPAPVPSPSGSPSTAVPIAGAAALGTPANSATVQVTIGNVQISGATQIGLRAEPPRITISNSTHIIATVVDARGNPLANVPVYFRVRLGTPACSGCEFFDVQAPRFTNNNGEAENVMRTRRTTAGTAQVEVAVPGAGGFITSAPLDIPIS